jgi:hypothetical protein
MSVEKLDLGYYLSLSPTETALKLVRELHEHGQAVHDGTIAFDASITERSSKYAVFAGAITVTQPSVARARKRWNELSGTQTDVAMGVSPIRLPKRKLAAAVNTDQIIFDFLDENGKLAYGDQALASRILRVGRKAYISSVFIDGQSAGLVGAPRMHTFAKAYTEWNTHFRSSRHLQNLRATSNDIESFISVAAPGISAHNVLTAEDMMVELDDLRDDVEC